MLRPCRTLKNELADNCWWKADFPVVIFYRNHPDCFIFRFRAPLFLIPSSFLSLSPSTQAPILYYVTKPPSQQHQTVLGNYGLVFSGFRRLHSPKLCLWTHIYWCDYKSDFLDVHACHGFSWFSNLWPGLFVLPIRTIGNGFFVKRKGRGSNNKSLGHCRPDRDNGHRGKSDYWFQSDPK